MLLYSNNEKFRSIFLFVFFFFYPRSEEKTVSAVLSAGCWLPWRPAADDLELVAGPES